MKVGEERNFDRDFPRCKFHLVSTLGTSRSIPELPKKLGLQLRKFDFNFQPFRSCKLQCQNGIFECLLGERGIVRNLIKIRWNMSPKPVRSCFFFLFVSFSENALDLSFLALCAVIVTELRIGSFWSIFKGRENSSRDADFKLLPTLNHNLSHSSRARYWSKEKECS